MGVRLIKGIKIFEGMLKKSIITSQTKRLGVRSQHMIVLVLILCAVLRYFGRYCGLSFVFKCI